MEAIFTLSYPEYTVATYLQKRLRKNEGYSVQIPLSRQQKGFDLLLYNLNTKKAASLQIKSSRTWPGEPPKRKAKENFQYSSWFNKFEYREGVADFYVFFILYPKNSFNKKRLNKEKSPKKWWGSRIVTFNDTEIAGLLKRLKTKGGKPEKFFYFGFNEKPDDIFITRGLDKPESFKENLLEFKIEEIKKKLE